MQIYAIFNTAEQTFVKWGVNGGGAAGYCLHRGKPCFFLTLMQAAQVIQSFDNPDDYEVRAFVELEAGANAN